MSDLNGADLEATKAYRLSNLTKDMRKESAGMAAGFAKFLFRGNVVDLGVAVVIGAAAGAVITAFVKDIFTPLLSLLFNRHESIAKSYLTIHGNKFMYGDFLNTAISFLIIACVVYFFVITPVQKLAASDKIVPLDTDKRKCPECLSDIPKSARRCAFCTAVVEPVP